MDRTKALEAIRYLQNYSKEYVDPKYMEKFDDIISYVESSHELNDDLLKHHVNKCQQIAVLSERIAELEGTMKADKERLRLAGLRVGLANWGCETPDMMADIILTTQVRIVKESNLTPRDAAALWEMIEKSHFQTMPISEFNTLVGKIKSYIFSLTKRSE